MGKAKLGKSKHKQLTRRTGQHIMDATQALSNASDILTALPSETVGGIKVFYLSVEEKERLTNRINNALVALVQAQNSTIEVRDLIEDAP